MTTAELKEFIALAVEIAQDRNLPLIEALDDAAYIFPELQAVSDDMPACEVLPFDPRYWG